MPFYNSGRGERIIHSLLQPRGDIIYDSGVVTPPRLGCKNAVVRTPDTNTFEILPFYPRPQSVHTSRQGIGEAPAPVPSPTLLSHWANKTEQLFLVSTCLVERTAPGSVFKGKGKACPLRQLEKNPRFHIAYRQLGDDNQNGRHSLSRVFSGELLFVDFTR